MIYLSIAAALCTLIAAGAFLASRIIPARLWPWNRPADREALDEATRTWLQAPIEVDPQMVIFASAFGLPPPESRFRSMQCETCGGVHFRACPRVKEQRWHENGMKAAAIYWPDGEWSDTDIIWAEDVFDVESTSMEVVAE